MSWWISELVQIGGFDHITGVLFSNQQCPSVSLTLLISYLLWINPHHRGRQQQNIINSTTIVFQWKLILPYLLLCWTYSLLLVTVVPLLTWDLWRKNRVVADFHLAWLKQSRSSTQFNNNKKHLKLYNVWNSGVICSRIY